MMRTKARLDSIERRLDKIAEKLETLYGIDWPDTQVRMSWGIAYARAKRYERIPRIEKHLDLILDFLGLEVEKVPATHEYFKLRKKGGLWGRAEQDTAEEAERPEAE